MANRPLSLPSMINHGMFELFGLTKGYERQEMRRKALHNKRTFDVRGHRPQVLSSGHEVEPLRLEEGVLADYSDSVLGFFFDRYIRLE